MRNDSERDAVTLSGLLINTYIVKNIFGEIIIYMAYSANYNKFIIGGIQLFIRYSAIYYATNSQNYVNFSRTSSLY